MQWFGDSYKGSGLILYLLSVGYAPTGFPEIPSQSALEALGKHNMFEQTVDTPIKGPFEDYDDTSIED